VLPHFISNFVNLGFLSNFIINYEYYLININFIVYFQMYNAPITPIYVAKEFEKYLIIILIEYTKISLLVLVNSYY